MRFVTSIAAVQLRSVAQRYRRGALPTALECGSHRWLLQHRTAAEPSEDDAAAGIRRRQRVEAILLLAREPLNSRKLAQYARLTDGTEARTVVRRLNRLYDETGRAFRVEEVAGGFRLLTRRQFAPWLRRLEHVPAETRLSAPAMETLAVVAYRQPVLRAEIEAVRGVSCGEILRQLMDRDLVRIGGRSEELGRPYLYTTTRHFLQLFGLHSLEQLPRAEFIRSEDASAECEPAGENDPIDPPWEEKTDVTTTSIIPVSANAPLDKVVPIETEMSYDEEIDDDDFNFDDEKDDEEEEEEGDDESDGDDVDWDEDLDDDFDDSEWEEVDDDDDWSDDDGDDDLDFDEDDEDV